MIKLKNFIVPTIFSITIILGFAGHSKGEDRWIYLAKTDKVTYYYDKESVVNTPEGYINVWSKIVNKDYSLGYTEYHFKLLGIEKDKELQKKINKPTTRIDMSLREFDCKRRRYRILSERYYYESETRFRQSEKLELNEWIYIIPNSVTEIFYEELCKSSSKSK